MRLPYRGNGIRAQCVLSVLNLGPKSLPTGWVGDWTSVQDLELLERKLEERVAEILATEVFVASNGVGDEHPALLP